LGPGIIDTDKPRGAQRSDGQIKSEIEMLLREHAQVDSRDIQVDVRDGVVTLTGSVSSPSEIRAAAGIADNVFGTRDVKNRLTIRK
jgi:osmotically-inducible protein OsmY